MSSSGQSISFFRRQIWVQRCITPPSFIRIRPEWDIYEDVKHDKRAFGVIHCALPMWEQWESKNHLRPNSINQYQLILDPIRVSDVPLEKHLEGLKTVREAESTFKKKHLLPPKCSVNSVSFQVKHFIHVLTYQLPFRVLPGAIVTFTWDVDFCALCAAWWPYGPVRSRLSPDPESVIYQCTVQCMHVQHIHTYYLSQHAFHLCPLIYPCFFILLSFQTDRIHLLHSKPIIIKKKQRDNKGKSSTSVGISEKIWSLSQWKSCCKIMLISFWEKRAAWSKKTKKGKKTHFILSF